MHIRGRHVTTRVFIYLTDIFCSCAIFGSLSKLLEVRTKFILPTVSHLRHFNQVTPVFQSIYQGRYTRFTATNPWLFSKGNTAPGQSRVPRDFRTPPILHSTRFQGPAEAYYSAITFYLSIVLPRTNIELRGTLSRQIWHLVF